MRRALLAAAAALALSAGFVSAADAAPGNRLRLIYIKPGNPSFPDTQIIPFGEKNLIGAGGSPMTYKNPQLLWTPGFNGTRWLGIVTQVDHTAASSKVWTLDERQHLVPTNTVAGAPDPITPTNYDKAWTTSHGGFSLSCGGFVAAVECYTVTVAEYRDAARTDPTGAQTIITVPIVANTAYLREMTSALNGCNVDCAVNWPDGGTGANNATKNQFAALLGAGAGSTSAICKGDTVYLRNAGPGADGTGVYAEFNAHGLDVRIKPLANPWNCGAGVITLTSENWDTALDAHSNPQLKNGFAFDGKISVDSGSSGDIDFPLVFDHLWCLANSGFPASCLGFSSKGGGIGATNTRFEGIADETTFGAGTTGLAGFRPDVTFSGNHLFLMGKGLQSGGNAVANDNIFEQSRNDGLDFEKGTNVALRNTAFDWHGIAPNHGDLIQYITLTAGGSYPGNMFDYNLNVLGDMTFMLNLFNTYNSPSTISGQIDGATLTVTAVTGAALKAGTRLAGAGITNPTYILAQLTPTTPHGGPGTYSVTPSQTVGAETITGAICPSTTVNCADPPQNIFSNTTTNPEIKTGAEFKDNLYLGLTLYGYSLAFWDNPAVSGTGALLQTGTDLYSNISPSLVVAVGKGGTGMTLTGNAFSAYAFGGQLGTVTLSPSPQFVLPTTSYATALPHLVMGKTPGYKNRAQIIAQAEPADLSVASGGLKEDGTHGAAAGTFNWPVLPKNNAGDICWNQPGLVFDATKTCVQMGTTPAT